MLNSRTPTHPRNQHTAHEQAFFGKQHGRTKNQKRKAKVSRRPGLSSSSPPGFIKNLHPRTSGSIFNKKPDIPSRLPYGMGFLFSVFFWGNVMQDVLYRMA